MSKKRVLGKYDRHKYGWLHFAIEFVIGVIAVLLLACFVVGISRVDGESMQPTLEDDQLVFFNRLKKNAERNDIIAISMPSGDKYVKRVIALAGDTVDIREGKVFLNGAALSEPYAKGITAAAEDSRLEFPVKVEDGCFFVLGDNREHSVDSREFRTISRDCVKGVLLGVN